MALTEIGRHIFSLTNGIFGESVGKPETSDDVGKPYGLKSTCAPNVERKTKTGFVLECSYGCPISILSPDGRRYLFDACSPIDKRWNSVMNDLIKNFDLKIIAKNDFGNTYEIRKCNGKSLPPVVLINYRKPLNDGSVD